MAPRAQHATTTPHAGAAAADLRRVCTPDDVPWATTADLPVEPPRFGQDRALDAVQRAVEIGADGFNVFATGPAGTGRRAALDRWLHECAANRPAPADLVYLFNFDDPLRPRAIELPAGSARTLAADVRQLVEDAQHRIADAFGSESYRARHRDMHEDIDRRRRDVLTSLGERAQERGVALQLTPTGAMTAPIVSGAPLGPDGEPRLSEQAQARYEEAVAELRPAVDDAFAAIHALDVEARERHQQLNREVASFAIGHLVDEVRGRWAGTPKVAAWLEALREDAVGNLDLFRGENEGQPSPMALLDDGRAAGPFVQRYAVNVLVTNDPAAGAPVVFATDQSFYDLFGRADYETAFGAAFTDHRHLRAGAVHRAAGGYLVLDAADVLTKPFVWPRLKDVLRTGRLKIENLASQYMLFPGVSLDPEPVDVRLTAVLVGSDELYHVLHELDEDISRLFKLRADFDAEMPRDADGVRAYASVLRDVAERRATPAFDRSAIAAVVEHGSRLAGHRDRLSTRVREIVDVAHEAGHIASREGAATTAAHHVTEALRQRRRRSSLVEERLRRATLDGTVQIDVDGAVAGQVNGLAVFALGDHEFGHPVRITATVAPGETGVVDIDREAELSGPLHAKGFLIVSGFLASRYSPETPLSLRASIVLEQSHGPIEGDSASAAELLALLSALSGLPVDQGVAVTGAVDQRGAVQAVGGVNEKVEGFFAVCAARGLTGGQGVILPRTNLPHLMLDPEVVEAVRGGRFHVWPVDTVDEALALLVGRDAGACDAGGHWPEDSANRLVSDRLATLAQAAQASRTPPAPSPNGRA